MLWLSSSPLSSRCPFFSSFLSTTTRSFCLLALVGLLLQQPATCFSISRRQWFTLAASGVWTSTTPQVLALSETEQDKQKIVQGYARLNYLLDNWAQETTVCGRSDNPYQTNQGCERTPTAVMDYLGYKSTKDPLFRVDKTMRRLEELVPAERGAEFLEAVEKWNEAADEANGMAFVSSWGEANPGGGKDRVELFIERARKNVVDARSSLATIIDILNLS